jgi:transposase
MTWVVDWADQTPQSTTMNTLNTPTVETKVGLIKIAIDMHLKSYRVVRQLDHTAPQPAQRFEPARFYPWLSKQLTQAARVVVCYEAGCFGYEPARRMQKLGAEVLVIAPQNWDEQGKRQVNDRVDAQVMCRRLSDYLAGHRKALSVVRIPSREEEQARAQGRLREQLRREVARIQAMGRSLLLQRELMIHGRWWGAVQWARIRQAMPAWVVAQLEVWKQIVIVAEAQLREVEAQLSAAAPKELFLGEGELSHELIARELLAPERFKNGRQVGNYFGLCPSESSSGERRHLGSITKHGSPRLRRLILQLAWRVVIFQPEYRGLKRWGEVLRGPRKTSGAARKKAIVALARQLAVDLWRLALKRVRPEELGLCLRPTPAATA